MKSVYTAGMINFNKIVIQVQVSHLLLMYIKCTPKSQTVLELTSTTGASPALGKWGVLGDDVTDETAEKSIYTILARVYSLYWIKDPS